MKKVSKFFKVFVKERNVLYYVTLGMSVLLLVGGIVSISALGFAGANAWPLILSIVGLLAFVGLSVVGCEKAGAALLGVASFFSLVTLICGVYAYFLDEVMNQAMGGFNIMATKGMPALITCVAIFLVCAIACNVFAWLRLKKKTALPEYEEKKDAALSANEEA